VTSVLLVCGKDGSLKGCVAEGHAGFSARGRDIVCAAESMLFRTVMETLEHTEGLVFSADTSTRGTLAFTVEQKCPSPVLSERLKCAADFIRTGIKSLVSDYPDYVQLREKTE
jgi:uncharacterized protein YsxB (DUF464 family)